MKTLLLFISISLASVCSFASDYLDNVDYLKEVLDQTLPMMEGDYFEDSNDSTLVLNRVRLRMRGKVGLAVPFLAKFEVSPYIELFFVKEDN